MDLSIYISKHDAIKQLLEEISLLTDSSAEKNAAEISADLGKLSAVLNMHIASEDKFFYPSLIEQGGTASAEALSYITEMKSLEKNFADFMKSYSLPSRIRESSGMFSSVYSNIRAALLERMDKEEKQLYPLAR